MQFLYQSLFNTLLSIVGLSIRGKFVLSAWNEVNEIRHRG